jgi:hypothetical protein
MVGDGTARCSLRLAGMLFVTLAKEAKLSYVCSRFKDTMAKPIKETPVLKGKDAKVFIDNTSVSHVTRVEAAVRAKIRENFAKLQAIAKF